MAELDNSAAEIVIDTNADPDGTIVVSLSGELDSSNAAGLAERIESTVAPRPPRLVFDLSGLRFMDSAGIAVLVGVAAEISAVQVRDPTPIVRRLIEVTGLSGVLRIEP